MATNAPSAPSDLPPAYSEVVGNPQYGFVAPEGPHGPYEPPKSFTPMGVYPHPPTGATVSQPVTGAAAGFAGAAPVPAPAPVGLVLPQAVGNDPTTITCFNCGKVVTTRVTYQTAWHTHLVAGSVCVITMVCSLCCLGLVPYCFDTFKDAEHYCPNCNTFVGKSNRC